MATNVTPAVGKSEKDDSPEETTKATTDPPPVADTETNSDAGTPNVVPEKHPLQNRWEWYFFKPDKSKQWNECFKKIIDFDTVEDFWAVFNHVKPPSQVTSGCDYMIFKEGIKPMWEDERNRKGGRWLLTLDKREKREVTVDNVWMETLMSLVGEIFEDQSDDICGAVVQSRPKGDKVSIWTADCKNRESFMAIGKLYKEKLYHVLAGRFTLQYQSHQDTSTKQGSMSKSIVSI